MCRIFHFKEPKKIFYFQVFLAQPILWGLTFNGQKGAEDVIDIVINEFDNTMALTGINL